MNGERDVAEVLGEARLTTGEDVDARVLAAAERVLMEAGERGPGPRRWGWAGTVVLGAAVVLGVVWSQRGDPLEPGPSPSAPSGVQDPAPPVAVPPRGIDETLERVPLLVRAVPRKAADAGPWELSVVHVLKGDPELAGDTIRVLRRSGSVDERGSCLARTDLTVHGAGRDGVSFMLPLEPAAGEGDEPGFRPRWSRGIGGTLLPAFEKRERWLVLAPPEEAALELLRRGLEHADAAVRRSAMEALRYWDGEETLTSLWRDEATARALLERAGDEDAGVRALLGEAISETAGPAGKAVLWRFLFDEAVEVRLQAYFFLMRRHREVLDVLQRGTTSLRDPFSDLAATSRPNGLSRARERGGEALATLRRPWAHSGRDLVRAASLLGAGARTPEAVSALTAALASTDAELRRTAAWALGQLDATTALDDLRALGDDPDAMVRATAAASRWKLEDASALEHLAAEARGDDLAVALLATQVLGHRPGKRVLDLLESLTHDARPLVRAFAAHGLAGCRRFAEHRVVARLEELAADPHPAVRAAAR